MLAVSVTAALPQQNQQTVVLIGEIKISQGSFPPHRIEVTLETRGAPAGVTYADDEGKFLFEGLWPNVYYVVIKDEDFEPVRERIEIRPLSGTSQVMQVILTAKDSANQQKSKDSSSGGNPFLVNTSEYTKRYPKDSLKEFDKANKAAQKHEAQDAIRHFEKAISLAPDFYAARNNLGLVYLSQMDFQNAQGQFQEVLRINPSDTQAYFNLGNTYLLTKRFPEAEQSVKRGCDGNPIQLSDYSYSDRSIAAAEAERKPSRHCNMCWRLIPQCPRLIWSWPISTCNRRRTVRPFPSLMFLKASPGDPFGPKAKEVLDRLERESPAQ